MLEMDFSSAFFLFCRNVDGNIKTKHFFGKRPHLLQV